MKNEKTKIVRLVKKYGRIQSIMGYVNVDTLKKSYYKLMEKGAEEIGLEYGKNLDENIYRLHGRMLNFSYFPQSKCRNFKSNIDNQGHKYEVRAFEDEIVQSTFKEILDAIYEFKIEESLPKLKRSMMNEKKRHIIISMSCLKIRVKSILNNIDTECLITFLEQDIADQNFVRYIRRFLKCEVSNLKKQMNLEADSPMSDLYMLNSVCIYYILQNLDVMRDYQSKGVVWIMRNEEELEYNFSNADDAKVIYGHLLRGLENLELDMAESQICSLSITKSAKNYRKIRNY